MSSTLAFGFFFALGILRRPRSKLVAAATCFLPCWGRAFQT
jgi:hypothetical protein